MSEARKPIFAEPAPLARQRNGRVLTEKEELIAIESVVERVVEQTISPADATAADTLAGLREMTKAVLKMYGLRVPDDAWLDECIVDMREWAAMGAGASDLPAAEEEPWRCEGCDRAVPVGPILHDELSSSIAQPREFLCFDCIEQRLGRKLTQDDLALVPFNGGWLPVARFSDPDDAKRAAQFGREHLPLPLPGTSEAAATRDDEVTAWLAEMEAGIQAEQKADKRVSKDQLGFDFE